MEFYTKNIALFQIIFTRYDINTPLRKAHFLAQIHHESNGFRSMVENLNYSVDALISLFSRSRISLEDARRYGRSTGRAANQEMIANIIYGGAWGAKHLGNITFGDGWKFRGRGPLQCTGKRNYKKFGEYIKRDLVSNPDLMANIELGLHFAGWYWNVSGLNGPADRDDIRSITRKINGGLLGLDHRMKLLSDYKKQFGA